MEITFSDSFGATLQYYYNVLHQDPRLTMGLQMDLQFGDLKRMTDPKIADDFVSFKAKYSYPLETVDEIKHNWQVKLDQLRGMIQGNKPIRVWWSTMPDDRLGFLWLCDLLKDKDIEFKSICLPLEYPDKDKYIILSRMGELTDSDFDSRHFEQFETEIPKEIRQSYSYEWQRITTEHSQIRAQINGELINLPADFYDQFLIKAIGKKGGTGANVVGDAVKNGPSGIPDWWYGYRMTELEKQGKVKIKGKGDLRTSIIKLGKRLG